MFRVLHNILLLILVTVAAVTAQTARPAPPRARPASVPGNVAKMVPVVIDGTTADEKAVVVNGVAYVPLSLLGAVEGRTAAYDAKNKRVVVGSAETIMSGNESSPSGTKPVLEVVMGKPGFKETVESLGLVHKKETAIPEKLQFYSCVIINNENAIKPSVAEELKTYLREGGGLVLAGAAPLKLDAKMARSFNDTFGGRYDVTQLSSIVDWFGCGRIFSIQMCDWCGQQGRGEGSLYTNTNHPLGTPLAEATALFGYKGTKEYAVLWDSDEFCETVAVWKSEKTDSTGIGAFVHPYGKGRVYWQSVIDDPNYPKLKELFRAGVWRAATGKDLQ